MRRKSLQLCATRACVAAVLVAVLASCGGGGGGGGSSATPGGTGGGTAPPGVFSGVFSPPQINATSIVNYPQQAAYAADLSFTGSSSLYLVGDGDPAIVSAVTGSIYGNTLSGTITFRADLAIGTHTTKYYLHACTDASCTTEVSGSPISVPITYVVLPNISVQQNYLDLQRTGADPAPGGSLTVTTPAAAGTVTMTGAGRADVITATFDGSTIQVSTTQAQAGTYNLLLTLQGSSDARYMQQVDVTYVVNPPPGGELPLSVSPNGINTFIPQGTVFTQNLAVTRPTWTNTWDTPVLYDSTGQVGLLDLGNNNYQITIDAVGATVGSYSAEVTFSAGATGGTATVPFSWNVANSFYPTVMFNPQLDATSTAASLQMSSPVITVDGVPATWTATSALPWLSISPASGTTGTDPLVVNIDPTFGGTDNWTYSGYLSLSINRNGTLPEPVYAGFYNYIPELQRSVAVLSGTGGRIYVDGAIPGLYSQLISSGTLHVTGATLVSADYRNDNRFLGTSSLLQLDVINATPGTPIVVSANTPLMSSQVSIAVKAPMQAAAAYTALPLGSYRPSVYAPGLNAYYFSGSDSVYRWAQSGGAWTLHQATIAGVTGLALRQDEQQLYGVGGTTLVSLNPVTLAQITSAGPLLDNTRQPAIAYDGTAPSNLATLAYASDGRAIASTAVAYNGVRTSVGAYWISSPGVSRKLPDLTTGPQVADPGMGYWSGINMQTGVGLVSSPSHHVIAGTDAGGFVNLYQSSQASWNSAPQVPAGIAIVGISDNAARMVRSDGIVVDTGTQIGNLNGVVPITHQIGGYGLTQDGNYGLVYGYKVNSANGAQPASGGTLWVVDLRQLPGVPLTQASIVSTIGLSSPVGCTTITLASGETCAHTASITVAPGSQSAFVLGPRGLAAVPLPAGVAVLTAAVRPVRLRGVRAAVGTERVMRPVGVLRPTH